MHTAGAVPSDGKRGERRARRGVGLDALRHTSDNADGGHTRLHTGLGDNPARHQEPREPAIKNSDT